MGIGHNNQNPYNNLKTMNIQSNSNQSNHPVFSSTQPKSPPSYNTNSNFDFSGLSGNQYEYTNSPTKTKPNLQGPSTSNSKPIKPISKPGQSRNQN